MAGNIAKIDIAGDGKSSLPAYLIREQSAALKDLLAAGHFQPLNDNNGPYDINLSVEDGRLVLRIRNAAGQDLQILALSLSPYRRLIMDYFMVIDSYEIARREATPDKLEAIDMARRSLHNEGAEKLQARLKSKIDLDFTTARRFFTLICTLHRAHMVHKA